MRADAGRELAEATLRVDLASELETLLGAAAPRFERNEDSALEGTVRVAVWITLVLLPSPLPCFTAVVDLALAEGTALDLALLTSVSLPLPRLGGLRLRGSSSSSSSSAPVSGSARFRFGGCWSLFLIAYVAAFPP